MRIIRAMYVLSLLVATTTATGAAVAKVRIRAVLISTSLEQKPVPRMQIVLRDAAGGTEGSRPRTDFYGRTELDVVPGR